MGKEQLFNTHQSRESAVDCVVNRFRELILQRRLKPGDLVPSESVLAEGMSVSRGSVREAMKILSALGVVDIRRGDGTYVSGDIGRTVLDPFLLRLMMNDYDRNKLTEFREMIECDAVRAAIRNHGAEGIELMRAAIVSMETDMEGRCGNESAALVGLDLEFHRALAKATGNVLIEQLYVFILKFFEGSIEETYRIPNNSARALAYHKNILGAIEAADEEAALRAVKDSILGWAIREIQE